MHVMSSVTVKIHFHVIFYHTLQIKTTG